MRVDDARDAEIGDLDRILRRRIHHVAGLNIPVSDLLAMRIIEGARQRGD